jgi:hypothetical protein
MHNGLGLPSLLKSLRSVGVECVSSGRVSRLQYLGGTYWELRFDGTFAVGTLYWAAG